MLVIGDSNRGGGGFGGDNAFGELGKLIDKRNDSFEGFNTGGRDNSFNDQAAKAGESGGVAVRNTHFGVLIDEINEKDLFNPNHVAGADFDRYMKTEVCVNCKLDNWNIYFQFKISSVIDEDIKVHKDDVIDSFDSLHPDLQTILAKMNFRQPTQVQRW